MAERVRRYDRRSDNGPLSLITRLASWVIFGGQRQQGVFVAIWRLRPVLPLRALRCLLPLGGVRRDPVLLPVPGGQAVLQAGVAELVDGPDRAQDAAAAGVFEEPHEAYRSPVKPSELHKREGG